MRVRTGEPANPLQQGLLDDPRLLETIRRLVAGLGPERIVLFGSLARGEVHEDTDADLLVVQRTQADRIERGWKVQGVLGRDRPMAADAIVLTPEEWESALADGDPILREIEEEGVTVYERPR
jgi:predicted nucleotidyltransferase